MSHGARSCGGLVAASVLLLAGCGEDGPPWHIEGSARLPDCTEPAARDLDGTRWLDRGTVRITSEVCEDLLRGDEVGSCALEWAVSQTQGEIAILVDGEYRIFGRMCGDQLHLEGGWWLPVQTEEGYCTYEEDYAQEVAIEAGGSTLTVSDGTLSGVLLLRSRACAAQYDVTFEPAF